MCSSSPFLSYLCSAYMSNHLEGGTKDEMRISKEALFHGSWPKSITHALEKYSKISISSFVPPSKIFVLEG